MLGVRKELRSRLFFKMTYELKLEQFSGPIGKLLELIEEKKMAINEISMAAVTEDFLKYIKSLEKIEVSALADFIVVASRLVLIKSKSLLPSLEISEEEEEGIKDLEYRLQIYRELKPLAKNLLGLWKAENWQLSRPYLLELSLGANLGGAASVGIFYPGDKLNLQAIAGALGRIIQSFDTLKLEEKVIREKVVSLEEKIQEIVARLQSMSEDSLKNLSKTKGRSEVIIIFLALLHLAREGLIRLEQEDFFSDIIVKKQKDRLEVIGDRF